MEQEAPGDGGCPSGPLLGAGVLEVGGVPPSTEQELLVLYFESRRRSGGGPVRDCQRLGTLLFVTFEDPRDAQNVLSRGGHRLGGVELQVRPAPPWDPTCLLLGGLDPGATPELLEPPLETLLARPRGTFVLSQGPALGWGLLRLQDPITPHEFAAVEERAQRWAPAGAAVSVLRVPVTPSVRVRVAAPGLSRDLLELYFENRRSGGGSVQAVRLLPGSRAAIVTFQEPAVAKRVLQRPHRLQDMVLELDPHYPFLEPREGDEGPTPDETPTPDTAPPAPARHELTEPVTWSQMPAELPDALPGGDKDTEGHEPEAGQRHCQEQETSASVQDEVLVSALSVQDEVLVPAEPGAVRYLQRHYQELLASIPEVSLVPLEGDDVGGFRVSGEAGRCQAAAEFLQSLLGTVSSLPVTLRFPGVARFLRDKGGQSILQQLESRFQCIIDLDGVHWSPPDPQLELAEPLPPGCRQDPQHWHLPDADGGADGGADEANSDGLRSDIAEIKELLAALRPGDTDGDREPVLWPGDDEQDPSTSPHTTDDEELLWGELGPGAAVQEEEEEEEEEAQMVLAIQRSMDSTRHWEEEEAAELARATVLSLRSYCHRHQEEEEEEAAGLLAALEASLEEALPMADVAQVMVFGSFERDVSAVPQELEQALAGRLRVQEVASERLRALPATYRCRLTLLQRRHAVRLDLASSTATLHGFDEYTADAARDLDVLLRQLLDHGPTDTDTPAACWVRWDPCGTAVPYAPEAAMLLERAWLRQEHRLDLLRDGRPFTVDLERMEEYDIGNASTVTVSRSQPPVESTRHLLGLEVLGLEEEVRLMPLAEDSEEFGDTVRHFYRTLEDQHSKISVVKVQKLIHPLLYQQYRLKKGSMEKACAGGTATVERVLFHGTTETSSREICLHGFNRSFCGKNAALYGLGVYFAAAAAVSVRDRYSPPSADGTKYVFVAKVLTGEYVAGRPGLRAPPLREGAGGPPRRYDSVVDNPRQPGIFVIFNDTQAYPQYLITCRRRGGPS